MKNCRCKWVNNNNLKYVDYHDNVWGKPVYDDKVLFKQLMLEIFQTGLSYEIVFNKISFFNEAFDNFDAVVIKNYDNNKVESLMQNNNIIKNKSKILAVINNAKVFLNMQKTYKSFSNYIWSFTNNKVVYETGKTSSSLSDKICKDLKNKGMKFLGTKTVYAYLQAIGVVYSHEENCFLFKNC